MLASLAVQSASASSDSAVSPLPPESSPPSEARANMHRTKSSTPSAASNYIRYFGAFNDFTANLRHINSRCLAASPQVCKENRTLHDDH